MNSLIPEKTSFLQLANLCKKLEETTKKTEKTGMISSFLRRVEEEEIAPSVLFLTGTVFPARDSRVLDIGGRTVWKIIKENTQTPLLKVPLTILRVYKYFEEIADVSGLHSKKRKKSNKNHHEWFKKLFV